MAELIKDQMIQDKLAKDKMGEDEVAWYPCKRSAVSHLHLDLGVVGGGVVASL